MTIARRACLALTCGSLWQACSFPDYRTPWVSASGASSPITSGGSSSSGETGAAAGMAGVALDGGADAGAGISGAGAGGEAGSINEPGALAGRYRLVASHSSKCLDADGALSAEGHITLEQQACDPTRPQAVTLHADNTGYYTVAIDGSADCVDVQDHGTANEVPIVRAICDGSAAQQWLPVVQDDGSYFLVNRATGKCLDVPGRSLDDVSLQQYTCNVGGNQRWVFSSLVPQPLPLILDQFFVQTVWGASGSAPATITSSSDAGSACDGGRAPAARGKCHTIALDAFAPNQSYAGATWLYPRGNWGAFPGLVIAAGATRFRFQARGAKGGEQLMVEAGGTDSTFKDAYKLPPTSFSLTSNWQSFSLDLSGAGYDGGIIAALAWYVTAADNTTPIKLYIDDVVLE